MKNDYTASAKKRFLAAQRPYVLSGRVKRGKKPEPQFTERTGVVRTRKGS